MSGANVSSEALTRMSVITEVNKPEKDGVHIILEVRG
jgi:hypothetical protein